jgi:hypothetical protein
MRILRFIVHDVQRRGIWRNDVDQEEFRTDDLRQSALCAANVLRTRNDGGELRLPFPEMNTVIS